MKTILLMTAALLLVTPAQAGGLDYCRGTVVIDSEMDPGTETFALKDKGEIKCLVTPVYDSTPEAKPLPQDMPARNQMQH